MRVPKFVLNITWIIPKKSKVIHELNLNHDLTICYLCRVTQTTFVRIIISTNPQKIIFVEIILQLERKIISTNPQKIVFVRILSTGYSAELQDVTAIWHYVDQKMVQPTCLWMRQFENFHFSTALETQEYGILSILTHVNMSTASLLLPGVVWPHPLMLDAAEEGVGVRLGERTWVWHLTPTSIERTFLIFDILVVKFHGRHSIKYVFYELISNAAEVLWKYLS